MSRKEFLRVCRKVIQAMGCDSTLSEYRGYSLEELFTEAESDIVVYWGSWSSYVLAQKI